MVKMNKTIVGENSMILTITEFEKATLGDLVKKVVYTDEGIDLHFFWFYIIVGGKAKVFSAKQMLKSIGEWSLKKKHKKVRCSRKYFKQGEDIKVKDVIINIHTTANEIVMDVIPQIKMKNNNNQIVKVTGLELAKAIMQINIPLIRRPKIIAM